MNRQIRCAIYTRKSSEEGLEQSFNSLHAQREACEAYVISQRHEGWQALSESYDDGGFSGGNTDRPGLKRLLTDIHAGKIDTVVVYKVDRLTRSLADFAKIVELFDSKQVSFVSVTQQFNTTTSMGRLTLNVLLSFAQFEREVTGERIRDKVAASKAKGMWMGGTIPLGYDVRDKRLHINVEEAELVQEIYREYLRIGSVAGLKEYLDLRCLRGKPHACHQGQSKVGGKFFRGALYRLLNNHLYVGEVAHNGNVYKGEQEAIIDREQWLAVQVLMAQNRQGPKRRKCRTSGSLLTGILFDSEGTRLTPTHASKGGKRYRYYTSQAAIKKVRQFGALTRIPAFDLEQAVLGRIGAFLTSDDDLLSAARSLDLIGQSLEAFFQAASQRAELWGNLSPGAMEELAGAALLKVVIFDAHVEVSVRLSGLLDLSAEHVQTQTDRAFVAGLPPHVVTLSFPFCQVRRGQQLRLIIDGAEPQLTVSTMAILKGVARARLWYEQLVTGEVGSLPELAKREGITPRYVKNILRCAMLMPEGIEALLSGRCSLELTPQRAGERAPVLVGKTMQTLANQGVNADLLALTVCSTISAKSIGP